MSASKQRRWRRERAAKAGTMPRELPAGWRKLSRPVDVDEARFNATITAYPRLLSHGFGGATTPLMGHYYDWSLGRVERAIIADYRCWSYDVDWKEIDGACDFRLWVEQVV